MPDLLLACANSERIPLRDGCVHVCVTSPPYLLLRDYGVIGQLGNERTPEEYLDKLSPVFAEVYRVLRPDGVCWVNIADSMAGSAAHNAGKIYKCSPMKLLREWGYRKDEQLDIPHRFRQAMRAIGFHARSTVVWFKDNPMPESVNGWRWEQCRVKVGYSKTEMKKQVTHPGNHFMLGDNYPFDAPEWRDCPGCAKCEPHGGLVLRRGSWRPTNSFEYIFMLTKTADYFADAEAVREELAESSIQRISQENFDNQTGGPKDPRNGGEGSRNRSARNGLENLKDAHERGQGRNARTVWQFPTQAWSGAHFATFPEELPRRCLKASTSERGCCPVCGAPWARVVETKYLSPSVITGIEEGRYEKGRNRNVIRMGNGKDSTTLGWLPTCEHPHERGVPMTVLDPFAGSGTTGIAARELGHHFVGLDLSLPYLRDQARVRLGMAALADFAAGRGRNGGGSLAGLPMWSAGNGEELG